MVDEEAGSSRGPEAPDSSDARNPIERFLGLFAEVRSGEGAQVLLMFTNIFLILTAYYVLKVVREGLMIGGVELFGLRGDEIKAYLPAVMTLLLLGIVPAYGLLASRVGRVRLINSTTLSVIVTLLGFYAWGRVAGVGTAIGLSYYVYLGIVNVFLIAQFWSFANDIYSEAQGKRLFAIVAIGQSLGAVLGPRIAAIFSTRIFSLLLLGGVVFGVCMLLYNLSHRREAAVARRSGPSQPGEPGEPLKPGGGFALVLRTRYLLLIALMILVTNVVNTTGEYILSNAALRHAVQTVPELDATRLRAVEVEATARVERGEVEALDVALEEGREAALRRERAAVIGTFYGEFYFWVNLVGVLVQMFLVSRIFKYLGVRVALFVLPVIAFGSYAGFAILGGLAVLRVAKTAENATDYSLQNTVKQALFLPTDRESKYKAKAAIDTFFVRFGDTASAAIVAGGIHVLQLGPRAFALVNVALVVLWVLLSVGISKEHRALVPDPRSPS